MAVLRLTQLNRNGEARWKQEMAVDSWLVRGVQNLNRCGLNDHVARVLSLQNVHGSGEAYCLSIFRQHIKRVQATRTYDLLRQRPRLIVHGKRRSAIHEEAGLFAGSRRGWRDDGDASHSHPVPLVRGGLWREQGLNRDVLRVTRTGRCDVEEDG